MTKITTDAQAWIYEHGSGWREVRLERMDPASDERYRFDSLGGKEIHLTARLASTSPAPDGWVLVGYGMRSNVDGSIAREFVPAGWRTTTELLEKFHHEPWVVNGRASIVSFYAAPQPVVEKDNG